MSAVLSLFCSRAWNSTTSTRLRRQRRVVQDLHVQLAGFLRAFHGDVQRNHVRPGAKYAANRRLAILGE